MREREEAIETEEARKVEGFAAVKVMVREGAKAMGELAEGFKRLRDASEAAHEPAAAPRPWDGLMATWLEICFALAAIVGSMHPELGRHPEAYDTNGLHLRAWRWMWTLPPCSEARKAAFTLGHAAMMIDRWRQGHEYGPDGKPLVWYPLPIGQRAEALLRILRWHIDDSRGEASAKRDEPATIPTWERLYRGATEPGNAVERAASCCMVPEADGEILLLHAGSPPDAKGMARAILADHQDQHLHGRSLRFPTSAERDRALNAFARTAIASLPDGPWTMTSADVTRFLEMILEDA